MNSIKHKILLSLFAIGLYQGYAQNDNTKKKSSTLVSNLDFETLQSVSEALMNNSVTPDNSLYIQQIGSSNTASATIHAKNKGINLVQNGHNNEAKIDLSIESVTHNILQNGNGNLFLEYGATPNLSLDRQIIQDGNNQGVVIFGSNSLTDKLMIHQQGGLKTVTIRNFN